MVSWGFAFDKALTVFLFVIGWTVLGIIVAIGISAGALWAAFQNPTNFTSVVASSFFGIFLGVFIGSIIVSLGTYATIIKVAVESVEEWKAETEAVSESDDDETPKNSAQQ